MANQMASRLLGSSWGKLLTGCWRPSYKEAVGSLPSHFLLNLFPNWVGETLNECYLVVFIHRLQHLIVLKWSRAPMAKVSWKICLIVIRTNWNSAVSLEISSFLDAVSICHSS